MYPHLVVRHSVIKRWSGFPRPVVHFSCTSCPFSCCPFDFSCSFHFTSCPLISGFPLISVVPLVSVVHFISVVPLSSWFISLIRVRRVGELSHLPWRWGFSALFHPNTRVGPRLRICLPSLYTFISGSVSFACKGCAATKIPSLRFAPGKKPNFWVSRFAALLIMTSCFAGRN